ncbi:MULTISPECIES: MliC family protein [unclassified Serratia (in: enterobacteria)]|uniref:MliC family protein n=1 Tax=unclassified Serratia (in: enterobacteria) TaxID=2647522 RepID=UPI00050592F3|nr:MULTISPECIES: MliC family protein [unclassified Serratia (in: enterobacteria)]KFK94722.1 lipoprotein [Serratia sp. Ag2]KFK99118.1 lipoprotein [Serratia sp. Ag1]
MKKTLIAAVVLLLAGCNSYHALQKKNQTLHYQCGTTPLTVALNAEENTASFLMDGERLKLKQVQAASGAQYSDDKYRFLTKGSNAVLERNGKVIMNDCTLVSD